MGAMIPMGKNQSRAEYLYKIKLIKFGQVECMTHRAPGLKRH